MQEALRNFKVYKSSFQIIFAKSLDLAANKNGYQLVLQYAYRFLIHFVYNNEEN